MPVLPLAELLRAGTPVALLKVNVEGSELGVLRGATPALLGGVQHALVEVRDLPEGAREGVRELMRGLGFSCKQLLETYTVNGEDGGVRGAWVETRLNPEQVKEALRGYAQPCSDHPQMLHWFYRGSDGL